MRISGRQGRRLLLAGLVWGALSCSTDDPQPRRQGPARQQAPAPAGLPEAALSYQPDASADAPDTERRIARAQAALRADPNALEPHVALATELVRRARETSRGSYRLYARDVIERAQALAADPRIDRLATMLLLDEHRFAQAAEQAERLIAADPKDATAHLLLGDAHLELGDYDAAADAYQAAVDLHPDLRSYNRAAYMRWLYGDFDAALQLLDLALGSASAADPESSAWCFTDLGQMYLLRGDARRALAAADRALELVPGYVPGRTLRARALARQGSTAEAIDALKAVLEVRPTVDELLLLSDLQRRSGHTRQAAESFALAETLAEHDPRPMAHHLARHGEQPKRALALAREELQARRGIWAFDTLSLALLRAGETAEASRAIDRALATGLRDPQLWLHAALIDAASGRTAAARQRLHDALAADPGVDPMLVAELQAQVGDV